MPRLKGTKNKKKRQVRLKLPPSTLALVTKLSEDSGLPILKVLDDAVLEGASELRTETYAGLIDFNLNRRGKIIRERELNKVSEAGEAGEAEQNGAPTATGADGSDDVSVRHGQWSETQEALPLDAGSSEEFRQRAIQTAEHIANHPPFTGHNPFSVGDFTVPESNVEPPEQPVG